MLVVCVCSTCAKQTHWRNGQEYPGRELTHTARRSHEKAERARIRRGDPVPPMPASESDTDSDSDEDSLQRPATRAPPFGPFFIVLVADEC
jgi:hypothetical protein